MRLRKPTVAALLLSLPILAASHARAAPDDPCNVVGAPRVVAVGDVHGAYDNFVRVLRMAGIVDEQARWSGGRAHLVQTGDLIDRGAETRRVLDLMMRLEREARRAGGRVHALLGNHEVMNVLGDLRYVVPEDFASFRTPSSAQLRERLYELALARAREEAREAAEAWDEDAFRAQFLAGRPLGFVERMHAFSARGEYGRWLRARSIVARIDGVVFVHGGFTPQVAALGCAAINATARRELTEDFATTLLNPLESLVIGEAGPTFYRGLAREDESTLAPALDQVLEALDARAVVVGHTVSVTGRIQQRFGGRVVMIDVGLTPSYGGQLAALEIDSGGRMRALYPAGAELLERSAAEPATRR